MLCRGVLTLVILGWTILSPCPVGAGDEAGQEERDRAAESGRDLVLAYYYPWYIKGDWSRHGYDGGALWV